MHPFEEELSLAWPPQDWGGLTVLVAVSGGPDSVALLRALVALSTSTDPLYGGGTIRAAHLNHQLRGNEAVADEQFVIELCRRLEVPCQVERVDIAARLSKANSGLETIARKVRYRFLKHAAGHCGARFVAVAHTADDQAETVLHRIIRGTGIAGLSGMPRARSLGPATLLRPLLSLRRSQVLSYLSDIGQPYRTDRSNADLRFTRNRIRHALIPYLAREYNPNVNEALLRLGGLAGEVRQWMGRQVESLQATCWEPGARQSRVDTAQLHAEPAVVVREVFIALWRERGWPMRQMGFAQWEKLADMAYDSGRPSSPRSTHTFPGGILAEAGPEGVLLRPT